MNVEERADAVRQLGFTERQARFLATVMTHSGVCLPRQYTAFARIVYGQKTRRFFAKLIADGHASTCRCQHNRAVVYHVHGAALCQAIGEPRNRLRRQIPPSSVVPRLMLLDAVLATPETEWLIDEDERRRHLGQLADGSTAVDVRDVADRVRADAIRQLSRIETLGLERDGSLVLLQVITDQSVPTLRAFLTRLRRALAVLPTAKIRVVHARDEESATERRGRTVQAVSQVVHARLERAAGGLADRLEFQALPHRYAHLLPLAAATAVPELIAVERERKGERAFARPRPPSPASQVQANGDAAVWHRTPSVHSHSASTPTS